VARSAGGFYHLDFVEKPALINLVRKSLAKPDDYHGFADKELSQLTRVLLKSRIKSDDFMDSEC
jgi:hypothetical protein